MLSMILEYIEPRTLHFHHSSLAKQGNRKEKKMELLNDEKWIQYDNRNRFGHWLDKADPLTLSNKSNHSLRKT